MDGPDFRPDFRTCGPCQLGAPQTFPHALCPSRGVPHGTPQFKMVAMMLSGLSAGSLAAKTALPARSAAKARAGQMIKMKPMGASAREALFHRLVRGARPRWHLLRQVRSLVFSTIGRACHHLRARDTPRQLRRARLNRALRADNGSHFKDDPIARFTRLLRPLVASSIAKVPDPNRHYSSASSQAAPLHRGPVHQVH